MFSLLPRCQGLRGSQKYTGTPVVTLNRASAIAQADGPHAGLAALRALDTDERLDHYQPLHATRAEIRSPAQPDRPRAQP